MDDPHDEIRRVHWIVGTRGEEYQLELDPEPSRPLSTGRALLVAGAVLGGLIILLWGLS